MFHSFGTIQSKTGVPVGDLVERQRHHALQAAERLSEAVAR